MNKSVFKNFLFPVALLVYSTVSTPFPAKISFSEITVGLLILFSINYAYLLPVSQRIFKDFRFSNLFPFQVIAFTLLFFPSLITIINLKCSALDYIRDVVPLLYLFIPFFYYSLIFSKVKWLYILPWIISLMGTAFSFRYLYIVYLNKGLNAFLSLGSASYGDNKLYLTYEPSTHFAAVFLISSSISFFLKKNFLISALSLFLGLLSFIANLIVAQRAPTFLTIICVFVYVIILFFNSESKRSFSIIFMLLAAVLILVLIKYYYLIFSFFKIENLSIFSKLLEKQDKYGLNSKDSELFAVLDLVLSNPLNFLLGIGWGTTFKNPIVPDEPLRYTHAGLTYFLLKGGIVGIISFLSYLLLIFKEFAKSFFTDESESQEFTTYKLLVFLSVLPAVIIGLLFQPTYKTLSFGVVLLSLVLFSKSKRLSFY